jgi:hypothetical protein
MTELSLNEQLILAVTYHNVAETLACLERGADPNYDSLAGKTARERKNQPYTPLRLVMFCISDSLLEDNDLRAHAEVAKILLKFGADPKPAMELAEERYGKYNPDRGESLFMNVWHIVAGRK